MFEFNMSSIHGFAISIIFFLGGCTSTPASIRFDGDMAWTFLEYQVSLGPRPVGSQAHLLVVEWISDTAGNFGWDVEIQMDNIMGHEIKNIIAKRGDKKPWIILGAHYDTRLRADQDDDPEKSYFPVVGANDGASGVSILLELARILPENPNAEIWLVFFDAEDNGNIPGWDWLLGSTVFVESLEGKPDAVVILDMVADSDLNIYYEGNSNMQLARTIWSHAQNLGYSEFFIPSKKYYMVDDHTPFLLAGIPAVDIIDFDYPYWHTSEDTLDNVSSKSLRVVGETILSWLLELLE